MAASAIGYYGNRGDEELTEASPRGRGFLADVCQEWEDAAEPAAAAGVRVVHLRIGVVLTKDGGALRAMLPAFRLGLGGPVGDGRQYMSWVTLDDVVGAFQFALTNKHVLGPQTLSPRNPFATASLCAPSGPRCIAPPSFPCPHSWSKALFGEMGEALLLASARVEPAKLLASGFQFAHPDLTEALRVTLR